MNETIEDLFTRLNVQEQMDVLKYAYLIDSLKGLKEDRQELIKGNRRLIEEKLKYKNIINGMEEFFKYELEEEIRPLNDKNVSVWTICLNKLQELKGSDNNG